jgi:hypothetical protein
MKNESTVNLPYSAVWSFRSPEDAQILIGAGRLIIVLGRGGEGRGGIKLFEEEVQ